MKNMTSNLASIVLQLLFCKPSVQHLRIYSKVIYTKYSKHWPYIVAHTID